MNKLLNVEDFRWLIQDAVRECLGELERSRSNRSNGYHIKNAHETKPILVGSGEAARMLGISERTLWELKRRGELPYVAIGSGTKKESIRYSVSDLYSFVASRKVSRKESGTIDDTNGRTARAE